MITPPFIQEKLKEREEQQALRSLTVLSGIDFSSNDYLGFAQNEYIFKRAGEILTQFPELKNGSSGSRLIAGHSTLIDFVEKQVAQFHETKSALIYNSGYDANVGFFSCIAGRNDTILYDYLSHASIRDGIRLSLAKAFSFAHNDLADLEAKLQKAEGNVFVAVESIYSMDGDEAALASIAELCEKYGAFLTVDEAHSTGIIAGGKGLVVEQNLQNKVFARLHTFGKAMGCHGAAWLVSPEVKSYLVNFSRSFIYTTAMPPHGFATISAAYEYLEKAQQTLVDLKQNITLFKELLANEKAANIELIPSDSPIQGWVLGSNEKAVAAAQLLAENGLSVKPIRYPTVPKNTERIRIVLHSFNTEEQIKKLVSLMLSFCNNKN